MAKIKQKKNGTWTNMSQQCSVTPAIYYLPETYDEVVDAVKEAEEKGVRIRAVGAGHSSTDIAICNDILLDMKNLRTVERADSAKLKPTAKSLDLVRMDAGANIEHFNKELDDLNLAFPTLGIIDNQTISGAIATGTHGCVKTLPGFPGLVRSILLVAAGGKKYRIEPKNGISQPQLFAEGPNAELIQNDDTFYSALVHAGAFGIVISYIMEVEPQYWLMEHRMVTKWSTVSKQIENNTLYAPFPVKLEKETKKMTPYGINIAVNPHRTKITKDPGDDTTDNTCMVARFFKLAEKPHRNLLDRLRSPIPVLFASTMIPYAVLVSKANNNPAKLPDMLDDGLNMMKDRGYLNKSYKVWYQGLEMMADMTYGSEFAFDGTNAEWLKAVKAVIDKFAQVAQDDNLYAANTLMIRYSKGSPAYLAADGGFKTVAWVGTPVPRQYKRRVEVLDVFQEVAMANGGVSHWGKMNNRVEFRPDLIKKWFPKLDIWKAEMRKFNPNNTFSNAFTDRFGLTT
jgi:L-gulono-1,4-lactone dehydrogenase